MRNAAMFMLLAAAGVGLPPLARREEDDKPKLPPGREPTPEELADFDRRMDEWRAEMDRRDEDRRELARMSEEDRARVLRERIDATPKGQKAAAKRERIRQRNLALAAKREET